MLIIVSLWAKVDQEILDKYPKASIYVTKKTKVKFFVVRDDENETQTIVIRGSANLTNWIVDFKFWKINDAWLDIRVHKGFYEATREVFWDSVFDLKPNLQNYHHRPLFGRSNRNNIRNVLR